MVISMPTLRPVASHSLFDRRAFLGGASGASSCLLPSSSDDVTLWDDSVADCRPGGESAMGAGWVRLGS